MGDESAVLFCDAGLAARVEAAETAAIVGGVESGLRRGSGGFVQRFGGGAACFGGAGSPLNKVVGVGFGELPSAADWERVEAAYAAVGAPVQVELATLADGRIGRELTGRGYRLTSFENVLGMRLGTRTWEVPAHLEIRRDEADGFERWLDVVVDGFAHPEDEGPAHEEFPREILAEVMRDLAGAEGARRYLAYRDGTAAGAGSMRVASGIAALSGAATLPAHRGNGVQTALLSARLTEATADGCDLAVVTTEPGSTSQRNSQGRGFALLYTRAILIKE
ncbi:GNAT family N-acetyltransferase [Nocardia thailandica]